MMVTLRERLLAALPDFGAHLGYDGKAIDSGKLKARLWDEYRIRPLIDTRELWREEKQMPDYDPTRPITRALLPLGGRSRCGRPADIRIFEKP